MCVDQVWRMKDNITGVKLFIAKFPWFWGIIITLWKLFYSFWAPERFWWGRILSEEEFSMLIYYYRWVVHWNIGSDVDLGKRLLFQGMHWNRNMIEMLGQTGFICCMKWSRTQSKEITGTEKGAEVTTQEQQPYYLFPVVNRIVPMWHHKHLLNNRQLLIAASFSSAEKMTCPLLWHLAC